MLCKLLPDELVGPLNLVLSIRNVISLSISFVISSAGPFAIGSCSVRPGRVRMASIQSRPEQESQASAQIPYRCACDSEEMQLQNAQLSSSLRMADRIVINTIAPEQSMVTRTVTKRYVF
jgi:hypothetical protein